MKEKIMMGLEDPPETEVAEIDVVNAPSFKETPDNDPLAQKWSERLKKAEKHYKKFFERVKHNRNIVQGFNWNKDPDRDIDFNVHRANLIQGTITAMLPNIYAKNPEITVTPSHDDGSLKLFCRTIETVTNKYLDKADLKTKGKSTVRSAMTCSIGAVKVTYQQQIKKDPIITERIQDAQDNLLRVEKLLMDLTDDEQRAEQELVKGELEQTLLALQEQVEVIEGDGIVIDRILTEHILIDPSVQEFWDYKNADWICQTIPMPKEDAEALFGYKFDKAKLFKGDELDDSDNDFSSTYGKDDDSRTAQVLVYEIWDRSTQRVYTMVKGCNWLCKPPYSPEAVGERWYPFFLLPYQTVDGCYIGPSLVDLLEKLQKEYNDTRDKLNEHRDLIKPGYVASNSVDEKSIKRFTSSELGEVTLIETEGNPVNQVFLPKQHPPIDPNAYDTTPVSRDWEQVSGLQDAARSTMVNAKTATEANIMQQSLSGRVAEFRDQIEDWLQDIATYTAQILLLTIGDDKVAKICGQNEFGEQINQYGYPTVVMTKQVYDWRKLTREEIYSLIELRIRAGSTGAPNKDVERTQWLQMLQVIQPMIIQIMQLQASGSDVQVMINLLKETITRFDDSLDVDEFMPQVMPQQMLPQQPVPQQEPVAGANVQPPQVQGV